MERSRSQGSGSRGSASRAPLTTFVQADSSNFRELVQRLTGPPLDNTNTSHEGAAAAVKPPVGVKKHTFKLHERRQYTRAKLEIVKPASQFKPENSPGLPPSYPGLRRSRSADLSLSPSHYCSSGFTTSPVGTPSNIFSNLSLFEDEDQEEEKAIKERKLYFHSSPRSREGSAEPPELLDLFPLSSPKD
ncbi:hypothetical protein GIB67_041153 [Kingdonia uniflora]|uniref:VQ domain-containing protein n=1 Tax=Kingdonia uniflora TaxID=39325 RepID=A0A7J7LK93_9MAGN|nr:hypothetical protein GIB67_041153 [Kingdonia uniflora]